MNLSRRLFHLGAVLVIIFPLFAAGMPAHNALASSDLLPGRYIIAIDKSLDPIAAAADFARAYGIGVGFIYQHALVGFSAAIPDALLTRIQSDPRIVSIQPDRVVVIPNDAGEIEIVEAQTIPTGIGRIDGELSSTISGDGTGTVDVDVAVIDTGIDFNHPDLNVAGGFSCALGSSYNDLNGHGTHVAGIIGAIDNNLGVVGAAPGARLWAVRVLNRFGGGSISSIICGIDWVTANASTIEVANMSLGLTRNEGSCSDGGLHEAICNSVAAGVTYVVAAGNETDDAARHVPAAYDEAITVSALSDFDGEPGGTGSPTCREDMDDGLANFSNFGQDVDLIAPGVCILSTWRGGVYNTISGTSMASPHVAGAAALYKANNPGAPPTQVKSALQGGGTTDWDDQIDPDGVKEPLLNVSGF
jgi:subtilisin family serine protease